jgi:hypothetical protein
VDEEIANTLAHYTGTWQQNANTQISVLITSLFPGWPSAAEPYVVSMTSSSADAARRTAVALEGRTVTDPTWGVGTVTDVEADGTCWPIQVAFSAVGRRWETAFEIGDVADEREPLPENFGEEQAQELASLAVTWALERLAA